MTLDPVHPADPVDLVRVPNHEFDGAEPVPFKQQKCLSKCFFAGYNPDELRSDRRGV